MPDVYEVVKKLCCHFPEVTENAMNRHRDYKVRDKSFANLTINHHGDEKVALLLNASIETQQLYVSSAPNVFFVPPYVGHKGWYGIDLGSKVRWERVAELTRDAYCRVAPASLANKASLPSKLPKPDTVDVRKVDPFFSAESQRLLKKVRDVCLSLPETSEGKSFGSPSFKAGKKTFCEYGYYAFPFALFRVGAERQAALIADRRFDIPPYMGPKGWIRLNLEKRFDKKEVAALAEESYRHFALKRMLKALDGA